MPTLQNPDHERLCQALIRRLAAGEQRATALPQAYRETIYSGGNSDNASIAPNSRRLIQRPEVRARIAELMQRVAEHAEIDAIWAVRQLRQRVEDYNIDDYLTAPNAAGERHFDISKASREQLGKLAELSMEAVTEGGSKDDPPDYARKIKIKPYDPVAAIALIARICGLEAPRKTEITGKDGAPVELTLEQLVAASGAEKPKEQEEPK
jgi:hypothetical protein